MPSPLSSGSSRSSGMTSGSFWIGLGIAGAAIALAVVGFVLNESPKSPPSPPAVGPEFDPTLAAVGRPKPFQFEGPPALHRVELGSYDGRQVYRIRTSADGDELIVDFATGKFITVLTNSGARMVPPMGGSIVGNS